MNQKVENLRKMLAEPRTRTMLLSTAIILVFAIIAGMVIFTSRADGPDASAQVSRAPGNLRSVPGGANPTEQYAQLQEQQNTEQAERAQKSGDSAIPTIVRSQQFAQGEVVGPEGDGGVGFSTLLKQQREGGVSKSLWLDALKQQCNRENITQAMEEGHLSFAEVLEVCACADLVNAGFSPTQLRDLCDCPSLKEAGISAVQFKQAHYSAAQLRICGFDACGLKNAGYTLRELCLGGFTPGELRGAGFPEEDIRRVCRLASGVSLEALRAGGCSALSIQRAMEAGVTVIELRRVLGCTVGQLCTFGVSVDALLEGGFTKKELTRGGCDTKEAVEAFSCTPDEIKALRRKGVTAKEIRDQYGCALGALVAAGYSAEELRDAGFTAAELRDAGLSADALRDAGFSAAELRDAGFTAAELRDAGFTAAELRDAGFTAEQLNKAGFSAEELRSAGFSAEEMKLAGVAEEALVAIGLLPAAVVPNVAPPVPAAQPPAEVAVPVGVATPAATAADVRNQQLQEILAQQAAQLSDQRLQQEISQRTAVMTGQMHQFVQSAYNVPTQYYEKGVEDGRAGTALRDGDGTPGMESVSATGRVMIKAGDILFAVLDTSVNSDEPGPVLATIVSGEFKGARLIGSLTLPKDGQNIILSFNTMSIPDMDRTISIDAVAIDPDTARTALSDRTDNHYLLRYGSLFGSAFLEGFGGAFGSPKTKIEVGNNPGDPTIIEDVGRTVEESIYAGLGTVGQRWGNQMGRTFNRPPTVQVFSGAGLGILFTKDVTRPNR